MPTAKSVEPRRSGAEWLGALKQGALIGAGIAALAIPLWSTLGSSVQPAWTERPLAEAAVKTPQKAPQKTPQVRVDFGAEDASPDVQHMANWVVNSRDNQAMYFVILDKLNTKVFVFDSNGTLRGASPVLIGAAKGDDSVADVGAKPVHSVQSHERTTPAGRFVGEPGRNANGEDIVWVDYDAAVSMHRVRTHEKTEQRLQRLATATTQDNRISYGCINLPVAFYEGVLQPAFNQSYGVIYVLPEVKPAREVFTAAYAGQAT
jgi:hypothetical protein